MKAVKATQVRSQMRSLCGLVTPFRDKILAHAFSTVPDDLIYSFFHTDPSCCSHF